MKRRGSLWEGKQRQSGTRQAVGEREVVCVVCVQRVTGQEMTGFTEPGDSGHLASYPGPATESLSGLGQASPWLRACLLSDEVC